MATTLLAHSRTKKQIEQYLIQPTHALGLSGETGAGKGYVAIYLCANLLSIDIESIETHPYVRTVEAGKDKTGIDDIRELQKFLTLTVPGVGTVKRVVILEQFDTIGHEAQNALLKTLEEPPADTVIIITYSRDTHLLPTIHSRLQSIQILPISQPEAEKYFIDNSKQELTKAFFLSSGLIGLLYAILDNQAEHPLIKAIEEARNLITMPRYQRLARVDKLNKSKELPPHILLDGLYRLIDASYRQALKTKKRDDLKIIARRLSFIEKAIDDIDQNVQSKLVLSRLFLEL